MKKGKHTTRILLSFVGTNDAGRLVGQSDGAILTVFKKRKFDQVHLIWNPSKEKKPEFETIAGYVRDQVGERGYCPSVTLHKFDCKDVTDHNEIYPKLLHICQSLSSSALQRFTAAIASGTPAMQVCWILMAESGDFPLELIRSNEPRFGKPAVTPVKLGTGLPRILRLEEENKLLKDEKQRLIPTLTLNLSDGSVDVGGVKIELAPIEFAYYRYFAERASRAQGPERFSGVTVPKAFISKIIEYHKTSFPDAELFRHDIETMLRGGHELGITTFRANVSKANRKVRLTLANPAWRKLFEISVDGKRHAKLYGISAPADKVRINP
jgi:hypothetical protein